MYETKIKYELLELGRQLIKRCENEKTKRAYNDMLVLDNIVIRGYECVFAPEKTDEEIRKQYPLIEVFEKMMESCSNRVPNMEGDWGVMKRRLILDEKGICATVLLDYGAIRDLNELFITLPKFDSETVRREGMHNILPFHFIKQKNCNKA